VRYVRYYPAPSTRRRGRARADAAQAIGLQADWRPARAFTSEDFAFMLTAPARGLPLAGPGPRRSGPGRRAQPAPPVLRLQRRRAAAGRALVLRSSAAQPDE
jgi:hypothetical protein